MAKKQTKDVLSNGFLSPKAVGKIGELYARRYYLKLGFVVRDLNWRCRIGELDLVMKKGPLWAFVEVKTRIDSPMAREYIHSNVGPRKLRKLRNLVEVYQMLHPRESFHELRLDAVFIIISKFGRLMDLECMEAV